MMITENKNAKVIGLVAAGVLAVAGLGFATFKLVKHLKAKKAEKTEVKEAATKSEPIDTKTENS